MPINRTADTADEYLVEDKFDVNARPSGGQPSAIDEGWGELSAPRQSSYTVDFKHSEQIQVIKFLDAEGPFARYKQHFLKNKATGKKSYVCLGASCPLCELDPKTGGLAEDKWAFTIANLSADPIERQILVATPKLYRMLHTLTFSPQGPLPSKYWGISKSGERQTTNYHLTPIKGRDLGEDWSIDEKAAEAAIAEMTPFTKDTISIASYETLAEIAATLS